MQTLPIFVNCNIDLKCNSICLYFLILKVIVKPVRNSFVSKCNAAWVWGLYLLTDKQQLQFCLGILYILARTHRERHWQQQWYTCSCRIMTLTSWGRYVVVFVLVHTKWPTELPPLHALFDKGHTWKRLVVESLIFPRNISAAYCWCPNLKFEGTKGQREILDITKYQFV